MLLDYRCWDRQGWRSFALGVLLIVLLGFMAVGPVYALNQHILGAGDVLVDQIAVGALAPYYVALLAATGQVLKNYAVVLHERNIHPSLPLSCPHDPPKP